jgi:hypothetical protein
MLLGCVLLAHPALTCFGKTASETAIGYERKDSAGHRGWVARRHQ